MLIATKHCLINELEWLMAGQESHTVSHLWNRYNQFAPMLGSWLNPFDVASADKGTKSHVCGLMGNFLHNLKQSSAKQDFQSRWNSIEEKFTTSGQTSWLLTWKRNSNERFFDSLAWGRRPNTPRLECHHTMLIPQSKWLHKQTLKCSEWVNQPYGRLNWWYASSKLKMVSSNPEPYSLVQS